MADSDLNTEKFISIPDILAKKRDGIELSSDEIKQFIDGISNGTVQECQAGAMLMAIYTRGNLKNFFQFSSLFNSFELHFRSDRDRNFCTDNSHA